MRDLLDLDDLTLYLRAEGVLTEDEMAKLDVVPPHNTPNKVIQTLACLIKQKGETGLEKFMSALRRSTEIGHQPGHLELLQILESQLKERSLAIPCPVTTETDVTVNELSPFLPGSIEDVHLEHGLRVQQPKPALSHMAVGTNPLQRNEMQPTLFGKVHCLFEYPILSKNSILQNLALLCVNTVILSNPKFPECSYIS